MDHHVQHIATTGLNCYDAHNGLDYNTQSVQGKPVLAAAAGLVRESRWQNPSCFERRFRAICFGYGIANIIRQLFMGIWQQHQLRQMYLFPLSRIFCGS